MATCRRGRPPTHVEVTFFRRDFCQSGGTSITSISISASNLVVAVVVKVLASNWSAVLSSA